MHIEAVRGDITEQDVDVVVNAANSTLLGGGGVDGAIHRAAGPRLLEACRELRATRFPDGLPTGYSAITPGFDLPARWVVHTVGPNWHAGERSSSLLAHCFGSSLELAVDVGAHSIAFPAVSAGAYGWDVDEVARVAAGIAAAWANGTDGDADANPSGIELVRFVLFSDEARAAFERALA
ncbi:O-acetyl-ADP-ribose deacetylase [Cellulomonas sp. HZM]|uniref:O-acetyl-ADP-ribose deacetylase n=1 Tax=Cellulomonas sp. HZM TaxID=1454010 RepID=UPI000493091D|nr:O-acetyl-ADP-ribose deacetylase [Cellulomonas sp. HZM]